MSVTPQEEIHLLRTACGHLHAALVEMTKGKDMPVPFVRHMLIAEDLLHTPPDKSMFVSRRAQAGDSHEKGHEGQGRRQETLLVQEKTGDCGCKKAKAAGQLYEELLYAVGSKYPDETRHQTALRYIRQAEQAKMEASPAKGDAVGGGE